MQPERYQHSTAGQLVQRWLEAQPYWAFVPAPLPPTFPLDLELSRAISDADRALGELAGLGRIIPNPDLLIGPFLRREAVLSSRIEGTQTDIADLYAYEAGQLYLPGMKPAPPVADVQEVLNYVEALRYGIERIKTLPVSQRLVRELHYRLMQGVRGQNAVPGEFRTIQNWIGRPGNSIQQAEFVPPPVEEMQGCLNQLEQYIHADPDYPPLIRIGLIHYQFEAIHPFRDGNGRIGRLLISLLLADWKLIPLPLLYLSAYFEKHRPTYYDLLMGVSERADWRTWLLFFLRGVVEQSYDAIERAKQLQALQTQWREQLTQTRASALLLRLVDSLFESPLVSIPRASEILDVTYPSAKRTIEKLVAVGIIRQLDTAAYGKVFIADSIMRIVTGGEK